VDFSHCTEYVVVSVLPLQPLVVVHLHLQLLLLLLLIDVAGNYGNDTK
jgi:hypothetical protein